MLAQSVYQVVSVALFLTMAVSAMVVAILSARESYRRATWLIFFTLTAILVLNATELATNLFGWLGVRVIGVNGVNWLLQAQLVAEALVTVALGFAFVLLGRRSREEPRADA